MKTNRRQFVKLAILFCAALFCVAGSAPSLQVAGTARVGTLSRPGDGAATYILEENFEGTGTPSGWSSSGTVDYDYTGSVFQGAQSAYVDGTPSTSYSESTTFTQGDTVYVYFAFRCPALPGSQSPFFVVRNAGESHIQVDVTATGTCSMYIGSIFGGTTVSAMSANTWYHCWISYTKGTGANAAGSFGFSTDGTRPTSGNNYVSNTNGNATGQSDRIRCYSWQTGSLDGIFDRVLADDVQIGDSP